MGWGPTGNDSGTSGYGSQAALDEWKRARRQSPPPAPAPGDFRYFEGMGHQDAASELGLMQAHSAWRRMQQDAHRPREGDPAYDPRNLRRYGDTAMSYGASSLQRLRGMGDQFRAAQQPFREAQLDLMYQLQQQAAGQGPSMATQQYQATTQQAMQQAAALQASQRGMGGGMAGVRAAQYGQAGVQMDAAQQSAMMRVQEQLAAREQLAGLAESGRLGEAQLGQLLMQPEQLAAQIYNNALAMGMSSEQAALATQQQFHAIMQNADAIEKNVSGGINPQAYHQPNFFERYVVPIMGAAASALPFVGMGRGGDGGGGGGTG